MSGSIYSHRWHPPTNAPKKNQGIYLLHGIGEHAGRYERFAAWLTSLGYEVGAHDHPGHGQSVGKRGVIESDNTLVDAAIDQFKEFEQETGSLPILFGHSMGGLVATSMVLDKQLAVAGVLLSAPAYAPIITPFNKVKLKILELLAPRFTQQLPYNAELLTHDKDEQQRGTNDELNHRYKSASIVGWIVRNGERAIASAHLLSVPTLILIPGLDAVVDAGQTQLFVEHAPDSIITAHYYADCLHELLNETPDRRDVVLADIEHWLNTFST